MCPYANDEWDGTYTCGLDGSICYEAEEGCSMAVDEGLMGEEYEGE